MHDAQPPKWITLDMDSSVSPTHGDQEGTAWNGHFGCKCYHPLAYNLGSFLGRADLPEEVADWSLTNIQNRLIKIGARIVRHGRKITFQLAEIAVPRDIFGKILATIRVLKPPPRPA